MMTFEDLLCDACLHLMETSAHGVPLADFCKRCRNKDIWVDRAGACEST
jgi:hypothetical protein